MATKLWIDENGLQIPANRITKSERLKEKSAESLVRKALSMQKRLQALKQEFIDVSAEVFEAVMVENGTEVKEGYKGNYVFYNFNRSIKVESDVQDRIEFDDALIVVAKQHFDSLLSNNSKGMDEMIQTLIGDAFSTSKGKLDTKKVLSLVKYRQRIPKDKYPEFHLAIDAIEKSIRKIGSKKYHRISVKNDDDSYEAINLNFSSI